eukprot:TRINITY_DN29993_c0_g1_i2.p2 TRINITY_DN29993_c0_g1~~TRINITY_DN29993_c0_g1_i2.p2  ORF type:complete len:181 (+),score=49.15 TRINITY_DN29993_c0_g1_i2:68-544(+)
MAAVPSAVPEVSVESGMAPPQQLALAALRGALLLPAVAGALGGVDTVKRVKLGSRGVDEWRAAVSAAARAAQGKPPLPQQVGSLLAVSDSLVGLGNKDRYKQAIAPARKVLRKDVLRALRRHVRWELLTPQQYEWLHGDGPPGAEALTWPDPEDVQIP